MLPQDYDSPKLRKFGRRLLRALFFIILTIGIILVGFYSISN
jgi:hypothetical protein